MIDMSAGHGDNEEIIESTFATLDGAMGSPEKWSVPYRDEEHAGSARRP